MNYNTEMITLSKTADMEAVRAILADPAIWPHIHEDGTDLPESLDPDGVDWLLVSDGAPAGVFLAHARGAACWEVHTCLLPRTWGAGAREAARLLLAHLFSMESCCKVITHVPAYNRAALRFAKASGMHVEGINRASYLRNGHLEDQIMLGITRKEWTCQQSQH